MFEDSTHGGRHQLRYTEFQDIFISTHALTEGDITSIERNIFFNIFQLTPSRRATQDECDRDSDRIISTHALTEGDDALPSIPPVTSISTHALTEGDKGDILWRSGHTDFNSRPHGGRLQPCYVEREHVAFQLTPSRRATGQSGGFVHFSGISTHALTEGDS